MRLISAIIQPPMVDGVCETLLALDITDLTVSETYGFGRQNGHTTFYPNTGQLIDLLPKAKIELMVDRERLCEVIASITKAANTGKNGAGKIFVSEILRTINL